MTIIRNRRKAQTKPVREERKPKQSRVALFSVSFYPRLKANGRNAVIYCRLKYDGDLVQFSTDIHCLSRDFNAETLTVKGQPEQSDLLQVMKGNAIKAVALLRTFGRPIDLETVKRMTLGQSVANKETPNLIQAFGRFLERSEKEAQTGTIDGDTYAQHKRWAKRVCDYFTAVYGTKCHLSDVKPSDAKDLQLALKLESSHGQNYSLKIVQFTKRVFRYAVENLWIERDPFMNFRGNRKPGKVEYLTESELNTLETTTKLNPALSRVLAVFRFQCYTGLAWKDAEQLSHADIGTDEKTGVRFILKEREKSGVSLMVPLIPQAEQLLTRWGKDPICKASGRLVPVPPNATMNNYLKEIAAIVGIDKRLTTHMARRTFITLFFERGMSLKSVSTMAGHSNTVVTERSYLKVTPGKLIKEMQVIYPDLGKQSDESEGNQTEQAA